MALKFTMRHKNLTGEKRFMARKAADGVGLDYFMTTVSRHVDQLNAYNMTPEMIHAYATIYDSLISPDLDIEPLEPYELETELTGWD